MTTYFRLLILGVGSLLSTSLWADAAAPCLEISAKTPEFSVVQKPGLMEITMDVSIEPTIRGPLPYSSQVSGAKLSITLALGSQSIRTEHAGNMLRICVDSSGDAGTANKGEAPPPKKDAEQKKDQEKSRAIGEGKEGCKDDSEGAVNDDPKSDCREDFEASAYTGLAIDTFASDELKKYLNPDASGGLKQRGIFGFDFAYRLVRGENALSAPTSNTRRQNQLWVYGETVHGVRSVDVDCKANSFLTVCKDALSVNTNPLQEGLFILRNATSLEGYMGLRYEFLGLNQKGHHPANLYIKGQLGFLTVSNNGGDVLDMHHLGLGAIATKGPFQGSYLEVGWGRSDIFALHRRRRFKIDGYLEHNIGKGISFFTQLFVDSDFGRGSDAIQTFIGLNFDLPEVVKSLKGGADSNAQNKKVGSESQGTSSRTTPTSAN